MASQASSVSVSREHQGWLGLRTPDPLLVLLSAATAILVLLVFAVPLDLADGSGVVLATLLAMTIVVALTPPLIRKMKAGGMVGYDINKSEKVEVAELGGIAAVFAFSVSLSLVVGIQKLVGDVAEPPFLAAISVFFMAAMVGLIDDISDLPQRLKAVAVAFAALPLMLVHLGAPIISFPFGYQWNFTGNWHLWYWLVLVPVGVTGVANAMNMSAGYNGLETGQIAVISAALLVVGFLRGATDVSVLVFGAILGCALGMYYFNRFPARIFIGDIGALGLGAALAAGVIQAHIEFYGLVAISPAFFELAATVYFGFKGHNGNRKKACRNPEIGIDGRLSPPRGASHFTLAYWILAKRPMTERSLVHALLALYAVAGTIAIALSVL